MTKEEAAKKLGDIGQEHVLKYFDELNEAEKSDLLTQVEETDFSVLKHIGESTVRRSGRGEFTPLKAMELSEIEKKRKEFYDEGVKVIKEGKTAALLLAGGMGTRLGSDDQREEP